MIAFASVRPAYALGLLAILGIGTPLRGDLFHWQDQCDSDSWFACCERDTGWFSNWSMTPHESGCPESDYPVAADDVDLHAFAVYLDSGAEVWSVSSSGVFRMVNGGTGCGLTIHTHATFDGMFQWDGCTLQGTDPDATSFDINVEAEIGYLDEKGIRNTSVNINDGAGAVITGGGEIRITDGYLRTRPLGSLEAVADFRMSGWSFERFVGTFVNEGRFRKAGTGTTFLDAPLVNTGTVEVETGTLRIADGGSSSGVFEIDAGAILDFALHTLEPGAALVGPGLVRLPSAGHLVLPGGTSVAAENVEFVADAYSLAGPGELRVAGTLDWRGGALGDAAVLTIEPAAVATISESGSTRYIYSGTVNNAGTVNWISGNVPASWTLATWNNLAGGTLDISGGGSMGSLEMNNAGTIVKSGGAGTSTIAGETANTGTIEVGAGTLIIWGLEQSGGVTRLAGGDLATEGGSAHRFLGGLLTGEGTVFGAVINDGGVVAPGSSPGILAISDLASPEWWGTYTQTSAGTLAIELGGLAPGTEHDRLAVSGDATLDGTLSINMIAGFAPAIDDEFTIVTARNVYGAFAELSVTGLPSSLIADVEYDATQVRIVIQATDCPGDVDGNGWVDLSDLSVLLAHFGMTGTATRGDGDLDGDGDVDLADLSALLSAFGTVCAG